MIEFLSDSEAVFSKLKELFSTATRGRRRVILVAYVGRDAEDLLSDYQDVDLYCWPQIGATDPHALARLQSNDIGANVRLVDHLHAKLYWVEGVGYVVTSANLSKRALGATVQEEIGVFSDQSAEVRVDDVIARLRSRPVGRKELRDLQRRHDAFWAKHPRPPRGKKRAYRSFAEWCESGKLEPWKLGWWEESADESPSTAQRAKVEFGIRVIADCIQCQSGQISVGDWVLCFQLKEDGTVSELSWLLADFVNKLSREEREEAGYSHEAVQNRSLSPEHAPPFKIDAAFRRALQEAVSDLGIEQVFKLSDLNPRAAFIRSLERRAGR